MTQQIQHVKAVIKSICQIVERPRSHENCCTGNFSSGPNTSNVCLIKASKSVLMQIVWIRNDNE